VPFLSPITVRAALLGPWWNLVDDVVYRDAAGRIWTIPAGTWTDFASVPKFLQWFAPHEGLWTAAAILHDYFCEVAIAAGLISARDADRVFREVMAELGVGRFQRWLMWVGVRLGALVSPVRRAGWWRDAPAVLGLSVAALPLIAPAALVVLAQTGLNKLVALLVDA
jgi:hypothetical protein